jgi:hypothetical protein
MIYPSVTQVLQLYADFSAVKPDVLQAAAERGTIVHDACFGIVLGLPFTPITAEGRAVVGYVNSFRRWFDAVVDDVIFRERRIIDNEHGFHGEPDLLVKAKHGEIMLIDIKTPITKSKGWRLQLAAYSRLCTLAGYAVDRIGSLRLSPEGKTPKVDWYEGNRLQDFAVFLSALNVYRFFYS